MVGGTATGGAADDPEACGLMGGVRKLGAMFGLSRLLATGGSGEGGVGWPGFEMESRSACRFSFSFMSSGLSLIHISEPTRPY